MHFSVYGVFYSLNSYRHVSAAIGAIFRVILLQEYNGINVVSCRPIRVYMAVKNTNILM